MVSLARAGRLACAARDWPLAAKMDERKGRLQLEPKDSAQVTQRRATAYPSHMKPVSVVPSSKTRRHRRGWLPSRGARVAV